MARAIGVLATEHVAVGLVDDNQIVGAIRKFPETETVGDQLGDRPAQEIVQLIAQQIAAVGEGHEIVAIGVGFPGVIRDGVVEDSPNLKQVKGQKLREELTALLGQRGVPAFVHILNDADAVAAGVAAMRGQLDQLTRVWTLFGDGVGFGRYPRVNSFCEGGHTVVSLDPKENYCGCGGVGHLEGILGHRSMRLRFLDLEPEEIFDQAQAGDPRCAEFVKFWHRALAAATATNIHMDGPGKFYISGPNTRHLQVGLLDSYLHEMVKMSPLQGSTLEVISTTDETAIVGAAVSGTRAAATQYGER